MDTNEHDARVIRNYLIKHGETEEWALGQALGRELGWKTLLDVDNAVGKVDGVYFRIEGEKTIWGYNWKYSNRYKELKARQ